jgi:hypothetical protein
VSLEFGAQWADNTFVVAKARRMSDDLVATRASIAGRGFVGTVKAYLYDASDANKRPTDSPHTNNAWPGCPAPRAGLGF